MTVVRPKQICNGESDWPIHKNLYMFTLSPMLLRRRLLFTGTGTDKLPTSKKVMILI